MPPSTPRSSSRGPLAGIRVLELATVWAGPCSAMLLGILGADVVKVESTTRPDLTRRSGVDMDSSPAFHLANLGKRSVALDLDLPGDVELWLQLVEDADVVITNVQPPGLNRRGAGYEACVARNGRLIWGQISTSGTQGPERHYKGYAPSFNALSGLSSRTGYDDGAPAEMRSGGDMRVANDLTLLCLAALHERKTTGRGRFIDLSCREVLTARIGDEILDRQLRGDEPRQGNEQPEVAPAGVYPTADEEWLALEIRDDATWQRFASEVLGAPAGIARRSTAERWASRPEIDRLVAAWSQDLEVDEAARLAQAVGAAAARSMSNKQLAQSAHLWQRRLFFEQAHEGDRGPGTLVSAPWSSPANDWPSLSQAFEQPLPRAPKLGEHTEEILQELRVHSASTAGS